MTGGWVVMVLHVLPLAAGAAVSPALIGASLELLIQFGDRGRRMLLAYLLGALLVVAAVVALSAALPERPAAGGSNVFSDVVDVVLGGILLVIALVLVFRRGRAGSGQSGVMKRMLASRWVGLGVIGLGIVMMLTNVSTLVLVLAGSHEVRSADVHLLAHLLGYGLLVLGSLIPILLPLVWAAVRPAAATRELGRLNATISKHGRMLGIVVSALTAAYLLARGFGLI